jgi:hypothetical protein
MAAITIIATMAAIIVTAITDTTTIIGATVITAFGIGSTGQRLLPPPEVMSPTNSAPPLAGLFVCERPPYRRFSFKPSLPFALLFQVKPDQLPPIFLNGQATAYLRKMFFGEGHFPAPTLARYFNEAWLGASSYRARKSDAVASSLLY